MPKRTEVKSIDLEGNEKIVYIVSPNPTISCEAQMEYNRAFKDAIQSGALLKQKLQSVMEEQDIWNEEKQKRYEEILNQVMERELKLKTGGIKLTEAKKIALEIRELRIEFRELIAERNSMDSMTAEGQADNARFTYLGYACLVNEEGQRVFKSFDHYQENEAQPYVVQAARELAQLLYGLDADYEKNLEENKFLQDYEFVDEELRWIDEEGRYVDIDGRLIDENGRFIDTEGNFVDRSGRPLTNEGEYKLDFQPFLDDKGNPIVKEAKEDEEAEEVAEDSSEVTEEEAEEVVSEAKEEKKTTRGRPRKKPATKAKKASVAE